MARWQRWQRRPRAVKVLAFVAIAAAIVGIVGLVVMGLWNAVVPALFGGPLLSWGQALGLFALARLLFGGWGRGRHGGGRHWRNRFEKRIESLSPEERERMKEMLRARCGQRGATSAA